MIGTMVSGRDWNTAREELLLHPRHEPREIVFSVVSAADARLIRGDHNRKASLGERIDYFKDTVNEGTVFDTVYIASIDIDHTVAIKDKATQSIHLEMGTGSFQITPTSARGRVIAVQLIEDLRVVLQPGPSGYTGLMTTVAPHWPMHSRRNEFGHVV
jgi:hypothetical protein